MLGRVVKNMKKTNSIYNKNLNYDNLYSMWKIVRSTCKNKRRISYFEQNKYTNLYSLYQKLMNKDYVPVKYRLFLIFEPKPRLVMSQTVSDKIVNHFVANFYLLPYLENKLIDSNVATRKGKGSSYADKLFIDYINKIRIKYPARDIFVLKIDISKYFYNIDHNILMSKLEKDIKDKDVLDIIRIIISETNKSYVNETISVLNNKYNTDIPYYKIDVGLSIGAMTSQFLAIYYLNDLDHYIKEVLGCKYYIRYMDDFLILDTDKNRLKEIFKLVELELTKLKLRVNPKSRIFNLCEGINFLGYKYRIINNKFVVGYRKKTINKINKKLKVLENYDLLKYYRSYSSYYGYLKKIRKWDEKFKMKAIEKYEYFKKENPYRIIFIKEGSFYKTYLDDAKIVWNLFKYKWNNNYIGFGVNNSSKILDRIRREGLGYLLVDSDSSYIEVNGDSEVYDLYLKLSVINYDKYVKRNSLHELLDKVIDCDYRNALKIEKMLNSFNK